MSVVRPAPVIRPLATELAVRLVDEAEALESRLRAVREEVAALTAWSESLATKAREMAERGAQRCPWCECWLPRSAFTRASPSRYAEPPCDDCYTATYPRRHVPCVVCGEKVDTNGHAKNPMHRRCRNNLNTREAA